MTFTRFVGLGILLAGVLVIYKYFLNGLDLNLPWLRYASWVIEAVIGVTVIRRLGTLNYLEHFLVIGFWLIIVLFADFVVTWLILNIPIFEDVNYWIGMLFLFGGMFLFHRKRHVEVRKKLRNK